ncbi:MAG: LamG domain-containing protein, partial [Salibacteraceae bacterium]|nr:LamG domain-containing protein [Salibacteraceae bacterium]
PGSSGGSSAYSYSWSKGDSTNTIDVSPNSTTTYYVTITDGFAECYDSITVTVVNPNFTFSNDTILSCGSDTVNVSAGSVWDNYLWSNGDTTQTTAITSSGVYSLTVSNNGQCETWDTITVSVINPNLILADTIVCIGDTVPLGFNRLKVVDQLMLHYPMDGNADDYSINAEHGVISGSITSTTDRFGNANSALNFPNNANARTFIVNNPALFYQTQDFTYSYWIKPVNHGGFPKCFQNGQWNNGNNFGIRNNIQLMMNNNTVGPGNVSFIPTLNQWTHIVIRRSGSTISE